MRDRFSRRPGAPMTGRTCLWLAVVAAALLGVCPVSAAAAAGERTVMLVYVPAEATWRDVAYLAAIPAMTVADEGKPALIAVDQPGPLAREVVDYLGRYRPTSACTLAWPGKSPAGLPKATRALQADSAAAAAVALAGTFWKKCDTVVLCREGDYASALVASALAAQRRAPLLLTADAGPAEATAGAIKRLGAKQALLVGKAPVAAKALRGGELTVTELADAQAVLAWLRKAGQAPTYLAAVNPTDRTRTVIKKLSLAGVQLAAGRDGMVVPLDYDVRFKIGFSVDPPPKAPPAPKAKATGRKARSRSKAPPLPRRGTIRLDGREYPFELTGQVNDSRSRLRVDANCDGKFAGPGEGPLATGDRVTLGGKQYAVTLGQRNGAGKFDVRLTWPTARQVCGDLRAHYAVLGRPPEYLCLVGFPDAIPQAIATNGPGNPKDLTSDLPYTNVDADLFAEIGVARLLGESATFATVYASRVLTYDQLQGPPWRGRMGEARWENTYKKLFENVGFSACYRHDGKDLKWLVKPAKGVKGKRAREFDDTSPMKDTAAMAHMAHSWWKDLGMTFSWDSTVLLAPMLVESGGCLTATLDRQPDCRSVIARLLRNGAVGFVGNARPGIAHQEQLRLEFWNGVLAGKTIGQAHRDALNSMAVTVLDTNQRDNGPDRYQLYIRTLFGDPAFAMDVPSKPKSAPAHVEIHGDVVSVYAPAAWWPIKMRVPEDWKLWADKDLYVLRGAGTYPVRTWCREQYDLETTYVNVEFRTKRKVKALTQVQTPPAPLGWGGEYHVDENPDGTRTYRWRVRMVDFDQITGKIRSKVDRLDYRVTWRD